MFAEAAAAAVPQVVTAWNQVILNGIMNVGMLGGGATILWWAFKRWAGRIDTDIGDARENMVALDAAKLDITTCDDRIVGVHAKMDGITKRLDDQMTLLVSIDRSVNGGKK